MENISILCYTDEQWYGIRNQQTNGQIYVKLAFLITTPVVACLTSYNILFTCQHCFLLQKPMPFARMDGGLVNEAVIHGLTLSTELGSDPEPSSASSMVGLPRFPSQLLQSGVSTKCDAMLHSSGSSKHVHNPVTFTWDELMGRHVTIFLLQVVCSQLPVHKAHQLVSAVK